MTKAIMTVDQIELTKKKFNNRIIDTVNARDLHKFLEVETPFNKWVDRRIKEYEFIINTDFCTFLSESSGGRPANEYYISINMAKELSMVERNQKGKEARKYFIAMEEKAIESKNFTLPDFTNPVLMARVWADNYEKIDLLSETLENNQNKIEYYDAVMESNDSIEMSTAAKTLNFNMGRNKIFALLRKEGYLQENNEPYQKFCGDKKYFKMIQKQYYTTDKLSRTYHQTQILPKGIELIKNLYLKENPNYKINDIKEILRIAKNIEYGSSQYPKQTEIFN